MLILIIAIIFGLIISYFVTQNTGFVSLHFLNYTISRTPLYVVVVGALLLGLFLSWIISLVGGIATGFTIRGKESKIKNYKKDVADLTKRIHQLELENTKLKAETNEPLDDKSM